ncbi:MAG: hypothetical protein ACR2PB_09890 [Desulfocapsaceae bacterium]
MERDDRNEAYLIYLRKHPEVLKNEPTYASSPASLLKVMRQGFCTTEQVKKSTYKARREWEHFHLETARAIGIEISIPRLHQDKISKHSSLGDPPQKL